MPVFQRNGRYFNAWQVPNQGDQPPPDLLSLVQKNNWIINDKGIELGYRHSAPINSWLIQISPTLFVSLPDDEFLKGYTLVE